MAKARSALIELYRARESGMTWPQVGRKFGLSPSAARRAYFRVVVDVVHESSSLEEARKVLGRRNP